ncbi:MAG: PAS domain S-box protein [Candidatus Competibacteraceae bacterium]
MAGDLARSHFAIRKRERELAISEAQYRSVIANASVVIFQFDGNGVFSLSEGRGLARVGLTAGEAVGKSLFELYRDYPAVCDYARRAIGGEPQHFSCWVGDVFFDVYFNPVRSDDGQVQVMGVSVDITERKQAEEALAKSERNFRTLAENLPDNIIRYDRQGRAVYLNPALEKLLGIDAKDRIGKRIREYHATGIYESYAQAIDQVLATGEALEFEFAIPTQSENTSVHAMRIVAEHDEHGNRTGVLAISHDITGRKRAAEELSRYRDHLEDLVAERTTELARANRELHQAMHQLVQAEKLAALGNLVAGVAHELNTPLGNARTLASALGEHVRDFATAVATGSLRRSQVDQFLNRSSEAVQLLERNTARAADLIGHFKQVAVDQTSMRRRRFNLRHTLEELLATLTPQFKRTAHRIEVDIPADLELTSYPGPFEQVIINLVNNSLTHGFVGRETGLIQIRAITVDDAQVQIDYTDNGVGIPHKVLQHIFEPFFTTGWAAGSGLGLYITYNFVTGVLGGIIQVYSEAGQGVRFILKLPRIGPDRPRLESLV